MNEFKFANVSMLVSRLLVAFALIAVSGCVSMHERGVGRDTALQNPYPASADEQRGQPRCPVRHMYVCERQFRTHPGTCYCTPESDILQSGADGRRLF